MKIKTLTLIILCLSFFSFLLADKTSAKVIDTIGIFRITPPPVPTPPTKPEPGDPPTVPPTFTIKPSSTPTPVVTPTPEPGDPTSTPISCGEGEHLDLSGTKCLRWSDPGVPDPGDSSGQVLGASTMAGTGLFEENLFLSFFIFGSLLVIFGLRRFSSVV